MEKVNLEKETKQKIMKINWAKDDETKYKKLIEDDIEEKRKAIEEDINSFSDTEELKNYVYKRLEEFENQKNKMYLSRIDKYRKYS